MNVMCFSEPVGAVMVDRFSHLVVNILFNNGQPLLCFIRTRFNWF